MENLLHTLEELLSYVRGIWIKKRFIMIMTWAICPIAWLYVSSIPDVYESSAKVYVDTRSMLQPLLRGLAFQADASQEVQLMARTLLSRPNLEKIARNSDLDIYVDSNEQFQLLIDDLRGRIRLNPSKRENIFTINFEDSDPDVAKKVVEETLDLFVESTLGANRQEADSATEFLDKQIEEYEKRLQTAEVRLSDFKRKYTGVLPGSSGGYFEKLSALQTELEGIDLSIKEANSKLAESEGQLKSIRESKAGRQAINSSITTQYDDRIRNLQSRLDDLLIRFTDRHPDVVETQARLASLVKLKDEEVATISAESEAQPLVSMPQNQVAQQFIINIQNIRNELASLNVRKTSTQQKILEYEEKVDLIPQIEAEMTSLNRDYGITKSKYETLLSRRESASLSRSADLEQEDIEFRIIEPPIKPINPSGPNRIAMYFVALLIAVLLGVGIAFLLSQIHPVVLRDNQLRDITGFPVLGTISHVNVEEINLVEGKKVTFFWVSNGVILLGFLGFVGLEIMGYRLNAEFVVKLVDFVMQNISGGGV